MNDYPVITRFWQIYITKPGTENRYVRNLTVGVIAQSLKDAIAKVEEAYPGSEIWTVNHRGPVNQAVVDFEYQFHEHDEGKG
jgi:hypothetical protein